MSNFIPRHIGPRQNEIEEMLSVLKAQNAEEFVGRVIPVSILEDQTIQDFESMSEIDYLEQITATAKKNKVFKNYIGQGYSGTLTPSPIARNILENPGWYTQYTPYQGEISQGRLEALLNFQTVISDLTGMELANASLLDEATSAAEAVQMLFDGKNKRAKEPRRKCIVSSKVFQQSIDLITTRAKWLNIEVEIADPQNINANDPSAFAIVLQYPDAEGHIADYSKICEDAKTNNIGIAVASDLMALTMLKPPGEWGADVVFGNSQRFGVPLGYGGPHAAFFATSEEYTRLLPGRIIGVSVDTHGNKAYRMALQTREQHIKRERATSNICTAQALLAIMAGMYCVYHGPDGLLNIADDIHSKASLLADVASKLGYNVVHENFYDTIRIKIADVEKEEIRKKALALGINFHYDKDAIQIALDETVTSNDLSTIIAIFAKEDKAIEFESKTNSIPTHFERKSPFLEHEVFNRHHSETMLMRYMKKLESRDLSLLHSMIPLGSCTMKLNAASELIPISLKEFSAIHPFAPADQTEGYKEMLESLSAHLCEITGFSACTLQPNSGAQGEYAGLYCIRMYQEANGESHRNIALIPSSAHGTNPASAVMAGLKVVVVKCDEKGNIDIPDLKLKAEKHKDNLSCIMVTYPSTHGVFEAEIKEVCDLTHEYGGQVYMDGANMNAQVGYTSPGLIGADVCHLNLHKTFAIPHGGGGPGMGPICVVEHLAEHLPQHYTTHEKPNYTISAAPYGSASILPVSYGYIKMLGSEGLQMSTAVAIVNANYMKTILAEEYDVLYTGQNDTVAHELILDFRSLKSASGVTVEDVAKRLMDYGFHAPTVSFPVAGTVMIEPTESESKEEMDRFCEAMLTIRKEIQEIIDGDADKEDNVLKNAPHSIHVVTANEWDHSYSRDKAAYPLPWVREHKFWTPIGRINNSFGDRNLMCVCPPLEDYEE